MNVLYQIRQREREYAKQILQTEKEDAVKYFVQTELLCFYKVYEKEIKGEVGYCLKVWKPKANKPFINYYDRSAEKRDEELKEVLSILERRNQEKAKYKKEKKSFTHDLQVGDILHSSWGYDQTNSDFYQVTKVISDKSVEICEIGKRYIEDSFMSGTSTPVKDSFRGEPFRKLVGKYGISLSSYQSASKWDGESCQESHYA